MRCSEFNVYEIVAGREQVGAPGQCFWTALHFPLVGVFNLG